MNIIWYTDFKFFEVNFFASSDDFINKFSLHKIDLSKNKSQSDYYGYKKAYTLSFLWFEIEIILNK